MSISNSENFDLSSHRSSYRNYEEEARELVKRIIQQSLDMYQDELGQNRTATEWPTGENFTIELAKEAIDKLVKARRFRGLSSLPVT